jgi:hypothetical protein
MIKSIGRAAVIQHIVIVKGKPGTTEEQLLDACGKAGHMPNQMGAALLEGRHWSGGPGMTLSA